MLIMSMRDFSSIQELPKSPAVYALCAGDRVNDFVVYVGISSNLRSRIYQHLIMRDSSAVVESAPVQINVDSISSLKWWQHDDFQSRDRLEGAEIVAFEVLKPTMRSRGGVSASGQKQSTKSVFRDEMLRLFHSTATGSLKFPNIRDLARKLSELERRIDELESNE
jgi:hypothetical protein